jgi:hypothetical protein
MVPVLLLIASVAGPMTLEDAWAAAALVIRQGKVLDHAGKSSGRLQPERRGG